MPASTSPEPAVAREVGAAGQEHGTGQVADEGRRALEYEHQPQRAASAPAFDGSRVLEVGVEPVKRASSPGWGEHPTLVRALLRSSSRSRARALRAPASITAGVSQVASSSRTSASDASVPSARAR